MTFDPSMSGNLTGIVTDGTYLWAVTENGTDYVYRFLITRDGDKRPVSRRTASGRCLRELQADRHHARSDRHFAEPVVVDESTDTVYEYGDARILSTPSGTGELTSTSFLLSSGNSAPQGIADPMAMFGDASNDGLYRDDIAAVSSMDLGAGFDSVGLVGTPLLEECNSGW